MPVRLVRRLLPLHCLLLAGGLVAAAPASAQLYFAAEDMDAPLIVCSVMYGDSLTRFVTDRMTNNPEASNRFSYHARKHGEEIGQHAYVNCQRYTRMTPEYDATWVPGNSYENYDKNTVTVVRADFLPSGWDTTPTPDEKKKKATASSGPAKSESSGPPKKTAADLEAERAEAAAERQRAHEAVEARNRAAQEKYEAELAEQKRKVEEYERAKEEVARKKAEQQAAADAVLAKHRAEMEEHARLILANQDAQRRHALCVAGERAACEAKLAEAAVPKDAGEASTDTDARQCVTEPVISPNEAFKGALKAVVTNGCAKPVDIRICLMSTKGWDCGMTLGLGPQQNWTWWTLHPGDGVYWDAKTSGSSRQLGRPAGA